MAVFHQLKGMLKSQFILMKRNKCLSFIELFCPIIFIIFYFFLRLLFATEIEKYKSKYPEDIDFLKEYSSNLTNKITSKDQISYDIIDENTPIPYTYFIGQCKLLKHIAIIGKNFPQKLKDKITSHFWELELNESDENNTYVYFDSVQDFDNYISSKEYGTDDNVYPKICFGVSKIDEFKFGIHYNTINIDNEESNEAEKFFNELSPHIPESKSNKNDKIKIQENLKFFEYYKNSGYLMILKLISDYILQEITDSPEAEINFSVIPMIYDFIIKDYFHKFLYLLGFFIIISYSIIFSINIYKEISFRETKKKEYLKSMGMKERVFFISSFIKCFLINVFHSLLGALIIKSTLKYSQYIYLVIILFLFGLVIFSMTYFFQSFLQESRKGVILSLLCYCVMSFLYLPINSPMINKPIIYLFCILFPPTNLLLGFDVFYIFEKEFVYFNGNINIDVSQITILQMIYFFIFSFFLYLLVGYIITQFYCYEYGTKKNLCCKKNHINNKIEINKKKDDNNILNNDNDDNDDEHKPIKKRIKSLKVMGFDLMNTPLETQAYHQKVECIKNSFNELDRDKKSVLPDINMISNEDFIKDELEMDFNINKDIQEIRCKRRGIQNSMSNIKSNEYFINNNLKVSEIKHHFNKNKDSFMTKSLQEELSEDSFFSEIKLDEEKDEYNKIKDEINPGARLEIKQLKKYYSKDNYILNGLSFTLYENEIYALLGENGTGKSTFISILSGLIKASGGEIRYKINTKEVEDIGSDITTPQGIFFFRKTLGICPQNNSILFDQLTVRENLEIFCLFKYDKNKNKEKNYNEFIENEVKDLLKKFELEDQKDHLVGGLSGGQKRKLCIAIACCGRSKVIILDEPTGGIDISSRKNIWNILKNIKYDGKIILLITHFMDEASFLADKIGILRKGKLILNGTNTDLIEKYGQYISFKINKRMEMKEAKKIVSFIQKNYIMNNYSIKNKNKNNKNIINEEEKNSSSTKSKDSLLSGETSKQSDKTSSSIFIKNSDSENIKLETFKERIIIRIPTKLFIFKKAHSLLEELEEKYNITSYSIIRDQLEDVFINTINDNKIFDNKKDYTLLSNIKDYTLKPDCFTKFKNEFKISFIKRLQDYKAIISEIIFPVLLTLIACLVSYVEWLEDNKSYSIELNNFGNDKQTVFYGLRNNSNFLDYYQILVKSDYSKEKEKLKNYNFIYLKNYATDNNTSLLYNLIVYMNTMKLFAENLSISNNTAGFYLIDANKEIHKYEFASIISSKKRHSPISYTNYLLNNIIKYEIDKNKKKFNNSKYLDNVKIINSPFHLTYEEKRNKKSRNGFVLVFFISISLSLIPSNFVIPLIKEKRTKSKHLQLLSGLSLYIYWLNNYIFEILKYFFISLISLITLKYFNFYEKYIITLYVLYGPALISFTYCISYFINYEGVAQTIVLLINLFFGALGSSAILILRTNKDLKNIAIFVSYIFRLVPTFCISYGYNQLLSKKLLFAIDNFKSDIEDIESFEKEYNDGEYAIDYIKSDIIFLCLEIIIYTSILFILEKKDYLLWKLSCKKYSNFYLNKDFIEDSDDEDEVNEDSKEENTKEPLPKKKKNNNKFYPLEVYGIKKYYKTKIDFLNFFNFCKSKKKKNILNGLSFRVKNGECFGFLGVNGAGKTTTFKCLCKEIKPNEGFIKINKMDIFNYSNRNKYSIGYCPQFDSVFENLTVEHNLYFYGQLKGIKENFLNKIILIIMKKLDLYKFRDYLSKDLSGGNKRKLSVGISIICQPDVIFMDEPSTGMDPYTRRLLLDLLHKAYLKREIGKNDNDEYNQRAIILTTHSIEEVEALCDKIGILVNGQIGKDGKGTINKVVQKHSKGILLNVELKKPSPKELNKKYGKILNEYINGIDGIKTFLRFLKKEDYIKFLKKNNLGRDIFKYIEKNKKIMKLTICNWVKHLDNLLILVYKIKKYFNYVECANFKLNNFILKIKDRKAYKKCDSYIFGLVEGYKDELSIEEYSYSLTSLETVFLEFSEQNYSNDKYKSDSDKKEKNKEDIKVIF